MSSSSSSETSSEDEQLAALRYRFGGFRYSLRGPASCGPDDVIPEDPSLYTMPRQDD